MNNPFVCIKLKTGETLFAELKLLETELIEVRHPMQVRIMRTTQDSESLSLVNWIPFTDDVEFDIPTDHILYIGPINDSYIRFYGSSRIKEDLGKLQIMSLNKLHSGESKKEVLAEVKREYEELIKEYSIKFGFNPEKLIRDLASYWSDELVPDPDNLVEEKVTYH